jgi:hypothetical protein
VSLRIANEREQRRGLVLGLTLAEVLLLLLFLVLLALAAKLQRLRFEAEQANLRSAELSSSLEQLKPLQAALLAAGVADIQGVKELALRFRRLKDVEEENARLKRDNANLTETSALAKSFGLESSEKLKMIAMAMSHASKIDPSDPPALLKRALDVLNKLGNSTTPDDVRPLSEIKTAFEAGEKLASVEAQRDKLQRDVNNLMRGGNGLTYPSCWTKPSGQTEYIFDITLYDGGLKVRDATPERARDAAWAMVSAFPRDKLVSVESFIKATSRLFEWSKEQKCRFYTIDRDATGNDKQRYVHMRQAIEGNFYINLRPLNSTAAPAG